jgi:hypothetical protein
MEHINFILRSIAIFPQIYLLWDNIGIYGRAAQPTDDDIIRRRKDTICMLNNADKNIDTLLRKECKEIMSNTSFNETFYEFTAFGFLEPSLGWI